MKTTATTQRKGSAFITALIVIAVIGIGLAGVIGLALSQSHMVRHISDYTRAKSYAEAGVNAAYAIMKTNFAARLNAANFPSTNYYGGTYDPTVTPDPANSNRAVIVCVGSCGVATAVAVMDIKNFGESTNNPGTGPTPPYAGGIPVSAYQCSMLSGGNMPLGGTATFAGGAVHANGALTTSGNMQLTAANISSAVSISALKAISGNLQAPVITAPTHPSGTTTVGPVAQIPIPNIDLTPYYNVALANGQVYAAGAAIPLNPPGGIVWINGGTAASPVVLNSSVNGTVIVTGYVTVHAAFNPPANYPAIVSRDADILINAGSTVVGLVYAKTGNIVANGHSDLTGSLIANGMVDTRGTFDGIAYADSTPPPDGPPGGGGSGTAGSGTGGDLVGPTAWQN